MALPPRGVHLARIRPQRRRTRRTALGIIGGVPADHHSPPRHCEPDDSSGGVELRLGLAGYGSGMDPAPGRVIATSSDISSSKATCAEISSRTRTLPPSPKIHAASGGGLTSRAGGPARPLSQRRQERCPHVTHALARLPQVGGHAHHGAGSRTVRSRSIRKDEADRPRGDLFLGAISVVQDRRTMRVTRVVEKSS